MPLPRFILRGEYSINAKLLYALLLGRTQLSQKSGWVSEDGDVYVIYTIRQMANDLNRSERTVKAALAELEMGAAKGCRSAVYITVGTGIGGGVVVDGKTVHGLLHPEVGHMLLRPHPDDPIPHGVCPYHDGCLEGLAAGPAIGARVQGDARNLPDDHPAFRIEAYYLAQMCQNLIVTVSPEKIILGGGVMQRESLFPLVRQETLRLLGGYVQSDRLLNHTDEYIVPPALFPVSGLWGSYLLGKKALENA